MEKTDVELVHAMADGDRDSFAALYDRHAPRVFALLMRWLGQRADAEDVLQETFWQVWEQAGRYDPMRAPPGGWVYLIARSRAMDVLRRRRPEATGRPGCEPVTITDPGAAAEHGEASMNIGKALGALPEEQRVAVHLAFFDGMTHEQVARRQSIPLGTAKTRIRLGMQRLREILCEEPQYCTRS
jgi:RNA polymerase sigma-70 factor (ECF subfamily)